jgi:hypothetical protein
MKTASFLLRLSPEELAQFRQWAMEEDCSLAEYLRHGAKLLREARLRFEEERELESLQAEIERLG